MIAFTVVLVLALGGLAAAIISKGDEGKTTATTPTVTVKTTTVQNTTTTVTTQAAPGQRHRRPERDPELERRAGARQDRTHRHDQHALRDCGQRVRRRMPSSTAATAAT